MPLKGKSPKAVMHELKEDNKKKGKERGQGGKPRSRKQMIAIMLNVTGKSNNKSKKKGK